MACLIAAAQIDVSRVRRARCDLLSAMPRDTPAIARAAALDRYEPRALSRRKCAIRRFDAAFATGVAGAEFKAARSNLMERPNEPEGRMSGPANSAEGTQAASERHFEPNEPEGGAPTPANLAERTRGGAGKRNATRCAPFWPKRTRRISRTVARFGRTNPSLVRRSMCRRIRSANFTRDLRRSLLFRSFSHSSFAEASALTGSAVRKSGSTIALLTAPHIRRGAPRSSRGRRARWQ
jgi:hypothetical protein